MARPSRFRCVVVGITLPFVAACASWRVHDVAPERVVTEEQPKQLRVTRRDESEVVVYRPVIEDSAIIGREVRGRQVAADSVRVPLVDVAYVATPKTPFVSWVIVGVGVVTAAALLSFALSMPGSIP